LLDLLFVYMYIYFNTITYQKEDQYTLFLNDLF